MRFVDHKQMRYWQGDLVCSDGARVQSLDACDLDWVREIGVQASLYDAMIDRQLAGSLANDFVPMPMISTRSPRSTARLMISAAITVLPAPVGRQNKTLPTSSIDASNLRRL
jgi:hypothetical protein